MPRYRVIADLRALEVELDADNEDDAVDRALDGWVYSVHRWIAGATFTVDELDGEEG